MRETTHGFSQVETGALCEQFGAPIGVHPLSREVEHVVTFAVDRVDNRCVHTQNTHIHTQVKLLRVRRGCVYSLCRACV
jgi:hypothetical protein